MRAAMSLNEQYRASSFICWRVGAFHCECMGCQHTTVSERPPGPETYSRAVRVEWFLVGSRGMGRLTTKRYRSFFPTHNYDHRAVMVGTQRANAYNCVSPLSGDQAVVSLHRPASIQETPAARDTDSHKSNKNHNTRQPLRGDGTADRAPNPHTALMRHHLRHAVIKRAPSASGLPPLPCPRR